MSVHSDASARNSSRCRLPAALIFCLTILSLPTFSGCAAFRPLKGVPARYLPEELKGCSRENLEMVDLSYLRQRAPAEYKVDSGDVLAVYVESVLGQRELPPINQPLDTSRPPTLGYPLTVRDDGTLSLPLIQPINVRGKTIPQIERDLRYAYTVQRRLLRPGWDRILVTLHRPRQHRILVIRQEAQSDILSGVSISGGALGTAKRGTGRVVSLPAYRNDVLNALVESGGLPGLDAENVVYVMRARRAPKTTAPTQQILPQPVSSPTQFAPTSGQPNRQIQPGYRPQPGLPVRPQSMTPQGMAPQQAPAIQQSQYLPQGTAPLPGVRPPAGHLLPSGYSPTSAYPPSRNQGMSPPTGTGYTSARYTTVRGQSPEMAQTPPTRKSSSKLQLANYWTKNTPRRVAEHITGIPMEPRASGSQSSMKQAFHQVAASDVSRTIQAPFQRLLRGNVSQAGCSTCQTAPVQMSPQQMAPRFAPQQYAPQSPQQSALQWQPPAQQFLPTLPAQQFAPPPQQQWQQPAHWANAQRIAKGKFCNQQNSIRIPLELREYETITFSENDIILEDGDIVFIASRDNELFYTGGLLGGGEYTLPRDRDLDILEAIAIAESSSSSGGTGGRSALNSDVSISPSQAIILRQLPNGTQVPILVDLYRARTFPSERINIQPGDYILVQYSKLEAIGAFIERHIMESALFGIAASQLGTDN